MNPSGEARGATEVRLRPAALALLALGSLAPAAHAQDWLILQGIAVGEFWASDSGSRLLTRNEGHPGVLGSVRLFAGVAPVPAVQLVAVGLAEGGNASGDHEIYLEGLTLRLAPSRALAIEGGKLLSPVGAFAPRRLSPVNPLIGEPDAYPTKYPWGVKLSGAVAVIDYRIAVVSLPPVHDGYAPTPQAKPRVVVGGGITPLIGMRFGATYTRGSYLSDSVTPLLPVGTNWRDYRQEAVAFDGRVSRGYADAHSELAYSSFDVPIVGRMKGVAYYVELKYTWTPRFFTAARFQRNAYPFIKPLFPGRWLGVAANFYAGEVGAGFRIGKGLLAKVSYQKDDWTAPQLSGQALAAQLSYQFDVTQWLSPRR